MVPVMVADQNRVDGIRISSHLTENHEGRWWCFEENPVVRHEAVPAHAFRYERVPRADESKREVCHIQMVGGGWIGGEDAVTIPW